MKIGILGSGIVAQTLAAGFVKHGHEAMLGTRERRKAGGMGREEHQVVKIGSVADAARFGEAVVLAVKGTAAAEVLRAAGPAVSRARR